jgi:hypothetical protein
VERVNLDDLIKQMQDDEESDRINVSGLATPINYARSRGIRPQKVYGWIRQGKLETEECPCGRRVINVDEADKLLGGRHGHEQVAEELDGGAEGEARRDGGDAGS